MSELFKVAGIVELVGAVGAVRVEGVNVCMCMCCACDCIFGKRFKLSNLIKVLSILALLNLLTLLPK